MNPNNKITLIIKTKHLKTAITLKLTKHNTNIYISYNQSQNHTQQTIMTIQTLNQKTITIQTNISRTKKYQQLIDSTITKFNQLDILINITSTYETIPFNKLTLNH